MSVGDPIHLAGWAAVAGVALVLSAVFSGLETGAYVLNRVRLELRVARQDAGARRVAGLLARPQELVATILIGNNLVNYMVSTAAVAFLTGVGVRDVALVTTLLITPMVFVAGEMVPKSVFRRSAETLMYRWAWILLAARWAFRWTGLLVLLTRFSRLLVHLWHGPAAAAAAPVDPRHRVRGILAEGYAQGLLSPVQSRMADRLTHLAGTTVAQVMVDLPHVVSIPIDCSRERFDRTLTGHNYSRLPVWRDRPNNIVGLVNIYDVLLDVDSSAEPARHVRSIVTLPHDTDIGLAIVTLQRAHETMAVVRNAAGAAAGIVTMKDLVEEIVGELQAW